MLLENKVAYPQGFFFPVQMEDVSSRKKNWESLFKRIQIQRRSFPEYSLSALLNKYTEGWDEKEKYDFIQWFKMKSAGEDKLYKKFEVTSEKEHHMERYAQVINLSQDDQLKQLRKKLRSRVESADKILQKIFEEGLLGVGKENTEKVEYLSNILQKLKNEILTLKRPALVVARCNRAAKIFRKAGIEEGASFLEEAMPTITITRTAVLTDIVPQLELIRDHLVKETKILSFDRVKNLTKIIDFFDNHELSYSEPLKKAINTLLKPLESASNDILEVISELNKLIDTAKMRKQEQEAKRHV